MIGPLPYIGGKRRMARRLVQMLPEHTTYVEVFAGGAQVFFQKPPSPVEVINDLDGEVVNFLRCCQLHHEELLRHLRFTVASRRMFELYERQDPDALTDVQRAARFLYIQKNCFLGKVLRRTYNYAVSRPRNYNPAALPKLLENVARRLERVQLEQWPWQKVLERFDRPTTAFFCDPPYAGLNLYRHNFKDDHFRELAERLGRIQGKFLMTINDCALSREVFGSFNIAEIPIAYSVSRTGAPSTELVVRNYEAGRTTSPDNVTRTTSPVDKRAGAL